MSIAYADLEAVLRFRDERTEAQRLLLNQYRSPLVSFTMNIAGPIKRSGLIDFAFDEGMKTLKALIGEPVCARTFRSAAGCGAVLVFDRGAAELKELCVSIEDRGDIGRLYDLDVIDIDGEKLSRREGRRCLICGGPAAICARSRAHGLTEIQDKTNSILAGFAANTLAGKAVAALIDEVSLTPKPGLVDMADSGAHLDMDWQLMVKSAKSLRPYFLRAAQLGAEAGTDLPQKLQEAGISAERTMLAATNNVNTHKGAIYSMGLLCAAKATDLTARGEQVCMSAASIAKRLSVPNSHSHGDSVRRLFPKAGPREEAYGGFPNVCMALDMLLSGRTGEEALLKLMSMMDDSNVLWRGGEQGLEFIKKESARILDAPAEERRAMLSEFNDECIRRRLSPGGAADILAAALFLQSVEPGS